MPNPTAQATTQPTAGTARAPTKHAQASHNQLEQQKQLEVPQLHRRTTPSGNLYASPRKRGLRLALDSPALLNVSLFALYTIQWARSQ
eukprot:4715708-Alexandrium_andersonii.AAC.1